MNDLPTSREVVNEPKTGTFQIRINPEYKAELERLYSDCGMTLTENFAGDYAHNACHTSYSVLRDDMTVNLDVTGGLPFLVNSDPKIVLNDRLADYLEEQHRIGKESADEKGWISEEEML